MTYRVISAVLLGAMMVGAAAPAFADPKKPQSGQGYQLRRGGYSYSYSDSINTYGDSRTRYGGASVYRDPTLDAQTSSGPFDHGFFFDSAVNPRGGNAPYMN